MNAPISNIKDAPRIVPINESEEVQNLRNLLREANDELRKWRAADTSMHEIGGRECLLIERAVGCYLDLCRMFGNSLAVDRRNALGADITASEIKDLRDKIVACREIQIIPDED